MNERDEHRWLLGLERVKEALDRLGHPEKSYRHILVGGTNGKGSTSIYLERLLNAKGLRTGTTLSPHLSRYTERFRIDAHEARTQEISSIEKEMEQRLTGLDPTYFEWAHLTACMLFARMRVDYGIFEIGLGGRLDAANVLDPCLSVITNVALDHTAYLGPTISHIAREKACIARSGKPLITTAREGLEDIRAHARQIGAALQVVNEPLNAPMGIPGAGQGWNAALAVAGAETLGFRFSPEELAYVLNTAFLPGRLERVGGIILDAAHNPASMENLVRELQSRGLRVPAVVGILADKDYPAMIDLLRTVCPVLHLAPVNTPRSWGLEEMRKIAAAGGAHIHSSVTQALNQALQDSPNVVVTGSFYTVGEVRAYLICEGLSAHS